MNYNAFGGTLSLTQSINHFRAGAKHPRPGRGGEGAHGSNRAPSSIKGPDMVVKSHVAVNEGLYRERAR